MDFFKTGRDFENVQAMVDLLKKYKATLSSKEMAYYLSTNIPHLYPNIIKYAEMQIEGTFVKETKGAFGLTR